MTQSAPIRVEPPFGPTDKPREKGPPVVPRLKVAIAKLLIGIGLLGALLVFPFLLLVRASVWLQAGGVGTAWIPLAGGVAVTILLVTLYGLVAAKRLTGSWGIPSFVRKCLVGLVIAYAAYGVVYLSASNTKSGAVQSGYGDVNPVLRLGTATLVLVDPTLMVTDASRTLEDYRRMGLPANEASLHFVQPNGWVHAIDLRTLGRSRWRNGFVSLYFWAMGFNTKRHRGTADHLHVSLPAQRS